LANPTPIVHDELTSADDQPLTLFPPDLVLDYTIRESRRARTVRLNMTPRDGLVVVIPAGYNRSRIPGFIKSKQAWIENARRWANEQHRLLAAKSPPVVPETIELTAVAEKWAVITRRTASTRAAAREHDGGLLVVSGPITDTPACLDALSRWAGRKARNSLVPWLQSLSLETGLRFDRTIVGNQRTRWGSCSPSGTISLNRKLLFLPDRLVRYVLIHELCHSAHMNHSKRFWSRVRRHEPCYRELRRELGESWRLVPPWLDD
jgi:predicted metal-dependent hydrolase